MSEQFIKSAKLVGFCILLSRILGLFREVLCANVFGAGFIWDAFLIAFIIPNLFRRIFGEGALTAAFIPVFTGRLETKGKDEAFSVLNTVLTTLTVILIVILVVVFAGTFLAPVIYNTPKVLLISEFLRLMLPFMVFICLAAILGAALNSLNNFFTPAFAPVIFNVIFIAALLGAPLLPGDIKTKGFIIAGAVVLGGFVEMIIQVPPLMRNGAKFVAKFEPKGEVMRDVYALFLPVVFGLSLYQINEMLDYVVAEKFLPDGAVSALSYANRITQFPLSMIGVALATTSFPLMASYIAKGEKGEFAKTLSNVLRTCIFISIPASVGIMVLAEPVIKLLFEHGKFTSEATARSSWALLFYAVGIWCYTTNMILARAFYAQKDAKTPVRIGVITVFINFILNIVLVQFLQEGGIALATAISGLLNLVIMFIITVRRFGELNTASIAATLIKSVIASLIMAAACYGILKGIEYIDIGIWATKFANAIAPALGGAFIYFVVAYILKMDELKLLFRK